MELQTSIAHALFDKVSFYERVTRNARWFVIIILLAVNYPFAGPFRTHFLVLTAAATAYNLLRYSAKLRENRFFGSFASVIVIDSFFTLVLVSISGGVKSPYLIFLGFMAITTAYWYGWRALLLQMWMYLIGLLFIHLLLPTDISPADPLRQSIIRILSIVVIAFLSERLTAADREERVILTRANREINAARYRLLTLVNSMAEAVATTDREGRVTLYNGALLDLLDTNENVSGKPLYDYMQLLDEDDNKIDLLQLIRETGQTIKRDDLTLVLSQDLRLRLDIVGSPIYNNQPTAAQSGYILIMRDITREKTLEEERDEFISVVSHELKTPLAIAEANLSTALLPNYAKIDQKALDLIKAAYENVTFLGSLVADLTTLARAEREILPQDLRTINPKEIVLELNKAYQREATDKGLTLKAEIDEHTPDIISSRSEVEEIMQNFVTNALKYTKKGEVLISLRPASDAGVVFAVRDSGIGVAKHEQKKLFTKFYRSEDYRTRETGGSGLGLYISQKLAERLGGKIWMDSKLNEGSTFFLQLPLSPQDDEENPSSVSSS